jgi:thioredoxin reductase
MDHTDVCIVGGGPAGLAAAIELRRLGVAGVLVVDRESGAGGIPRHADHIGFGLRDMYRVLTGPQYARRYVRLATEAGVEIRTATTVTDWTTPATLRLTSPSGLTAVAARAVILATGCRERPRAARLVPGDRPLGVFTTGALQQFVYLQHQPVGRRAVVVGAEHVSFSALLTLAHVGATTVAMVTEHPRHQTYPPYKWLTADRWRVPILTSHRISSIIGRRRVEAVEITELHSGSVRRLECDTVVFTGDWIPDHELARRGGLQMDSATRAPRVDGGLRTSTRGVFAAGNLLHAAETADIAALSGRHAAHAVAAFLASDRWPDPPVPIVCEPPIQWVSPSAVDASALAPPLGRFTSRVTRFCDRVELEVRQGPRVLYRKLYARLVPTLPMHVGASWLSNVDPRGEAVSFRLIPPRAVNGRDA